MVIYGHQSQEDNNLDSTIPLFTMPLAACEQRLPILMDEEIWGLYHFFSWDAPNIHGIYPLVNVYITMENHRVFNG
jgi:hypothetical protein